MNLVTVIAMYASFCKELGLPLRWPGTIKAYSQLVEVGSSKGRGYQVSTVLTVSIK